ncbi:hypothetical protein DIPPA_07595 [Diplonema papillatum]|nr:hypothetical protein DIPPA_07595 [Diplonema papillatum]
MPPKQTSARKNTTLENLKRATEASRRLQQTAAKKRKKRPDGGAPRSADAAAASKHPPKPPPAACRFPQPVRAEVLLKLLRNRADAPEKRASCTVCKAPFISCCLESGPAKPVQHCTLCGNVYCMGCDIAVYKMNKPHDFIAALI